MTESVSNISTEYTRTRRFLFMPYLIVHRPDLLDALFNNRDGIPLQSFVLNCYSYYRNRGITNNEILIVFNSKPAEKLIQITEKFKLELIHDSEFLILVLPILPEVAANFVAAKYSKMYAHSILRRWARYFEQNPGGIEVQFHSVKLLLNTSWHILVNSEELRKIMANEFNIPVTALKNRELLGNIEPEIETLVL